MKAYLIGIFGGFAITIAGFAGVIYSSRTVVEVYKNKPQVISLVEHKQYEIEKEIHDKFNNNYVNNLVEELYKIKNTEQYMSANKEFEEKKESVKIYDLLTILFGAIIAPGGIGLAGITASKSKKFESDLEKLVKKKSN